MKEIKLTKGYIALVDDEDYDLLSAITWGYSFYNGKGYATRHVNKSVGKYTKQPMHRFILGLTDPAILTDHKDGNGLNNQRNNLRLCNSLQNSHNKKKMAKKSTSKYKGVHWHKSCKAWVVNINDKGVRKYLGSFPNEVDAAIVYNKAAEELFGEFALLNTIPPLPTQPDLEK